MRLYRFFLFLLLNGVAFRSAAQQELPLYPAGQVPNNTTQVNMERFTVNNTGRKRYEKVSVPSLTVFMPDPARANGGGVIICPGGGYVHEAFTHEGTEVAKAFNDIGYTAFVLRYRLPSDSVQVNKMIAPLQDAQRALQLVREQAATWKLDVNKIGIAGFSAGGHLAASASTHYDTALIDNSRHTDLRPSFSILIYPVISLLDSLKHGGSRTNLLGKEPNPQWEQFFSNELHVQTGMPPVFLVHAQDDKTVKVENSLVFYTALTRQKVPAEMHLYPHGGHGFGLVNPTTDDRWFDRVVNWLKAGKFL
jgi:acetyl esterase/lipase